MTKKHHKRVIKGCQVFKSYTTSLCEEKTEIYYAFLIKNLAQTRLSETPTFARFIFIQFYPFTEMFHTDTTHFVGVNVR